MITITTYKTADGKIIQTITCPDDSVPLQYGAGENYVVGAYLESTHYIVAGVATVKPLLTTVATWSALTLVANGTATVTLGSTLPNPTKITVTPPANLGIAPIPEQTVTDGSFVLSTTVAGAYTVTARAFPYQDYTVTINAT